MIDTAGFEDAASSGRTKGVAVTAARPAVRPGGVARTTSTIARLRAAAWFGAI